jgi:pimeloyl-ACP methyl ester carboxylesterase
MSVCAVFFGGYKATQDQVNLWVASAKAQKPGIEFGARPWPSGAAKPDGDVGVSVFKKTGQFESVVAAIRKSTADKIYIVGHSSGCAIANEVDRALKDIVSKLVLVALDGFRPDKDQLTRPNTQVWGAVFGAHKSYHYPDDDEKRQLGSHFKEHKVTHAKPDCTTEFALHFSLVNTATTNTTGNTDHGYDNCQANLCWVDEDLKTKP